MITLKPWQKTALSKFLQKKRLYLNWEVGTGKTFFFCHLVKYLSTQNPNLRTLYITPPGTYSAIKETFEKMGYYNYDILFNKQKWISNPGMRAKTAVMSPQMFCGEDIARQISREDCIGYAVDFKPSFLIVDEAHSIKAQDTKISKTIKSYVSTMNFKHIIMGSGTPIGNCYTDIFNAMYCLDKSVFGASFNAFQNKYFIKDPYKPYPAYNINESVKSEFINKCSLFIHKVKKESTNIKMPNKKTSILKIKMYDEQKGIYLNAKKKFMVDFDALKKKLKEDEVSQTPQQKNIAKLQFYSSVLSQMNILRQICNGFVYEQMPQDITEQQKKAFLKHRKIMKFPTKKDEILKKLLERIKTKSVQKTIIWSIFTETFNNIERVLNETGLNFVKITGKTLVSKRPSLIQRWNEDPHCQVFLSHPKAGGTGINLQRAMFALFYSQDFSFIDKTQAEGRNYRIGSIDFNSQVHQVEMVMQNTIEDYIKKRLFGKKHLVQEFENYLRK